MAKKSESTPRSRVRQAMRALWLRSRERARALKDHAYCCGVCGVKQTAKKGQEVKLEIHHVNGVDWEKMIDKLYETLLCDPKHLIPLCKECHNKVHETGEL